MGRSRTRPPESSHCLFCLTPVEKDKYNDRQNVGNNKDVVTCCKKLLKDKIRGNHNEWFSPAKNSTPLCVKCLKSAEQVHNVNKQLMEIKKVLDDLIEKFAIEINERVSRFSDHGYLTKEIKVEDTKDDTDFIEEDNDIELHGDIGESSLIAGTKNDILAKTSSPVKKRNRKSVLVPRVDLYDGRNNDLSNYLDADSPSTDAQPELFTSDELQSSDIKHEESVPSPVHLSSDEESFANDDDPLLLHDSFDSAKECASNYFPRIILDKLQFDKNGQVINPVKGPSILRKRKSAIKAAENLRKIAIEASSVDYDPPMERNYVPIAAEGSTLAPNSLNLISLPVTAYELLNLVCATCNKQFSEFQNLLNHKQTPCNITNVLKTQISTTARKLGSRIKDKEKLKTQISRKRNRKRKLKKPRKERIKPECRICGRPTNVSHIYEHMLSHCGEHEKRYRCSFCGKGFNLRRLFKDHVDYFHSSAEEGSHVCNVCDKICKTKLRLQCHMQSHKKFSCSKCSMSFKCRVTLIRHENIHNGKVYTCSFCSKPCLSEHILKAHKKLYHSGDGRRQYKVQKSANKNSYVLTRDHSKVEHKGMGRVYECPICKKELRSPEGFNVHMKNHGEKEFVCDICGSQFATMRQLILHSDIHKKEESECRICGKTFKNKKSLRMHEIKVHEKEKNHLCEQCGYRANQKCKVDLHIQRVHEKLLNFNCSICGKAFNQKTNCQKHEKTHLDKEVRYIDAIKCEICPYKQFANSTSLRTHQIYSHSAYTQQIANCDKCTNKFMNGLELYRHRRRSPPKESKCVHCKTKFDSRCDLLFHIANIHSGEKLPYKCQVCALVFNSPFLLKDHLKIECGKMIPIEKQERKVIRKKKDKKVMTKEKIKETILYACSFCGKTFALKQNCIVHENTHTKVKPFQCAFCSKCFSQKSNLQKHERIHTGERPFQCTYCPKAFPQSDQLKTHIRIHTGEKPFSCTVCDKRFSDYSTYFKHKKVHAQ